MSYGFFALLFRMKYIDRWSLMRSFRSENLSEHSLEVALLSHALAIIGNERFGKHYDSERICLKALFHDVPEIITGDLPTPVKYYNANTKFAYEKVEDNAKARLISLLPDEMKKDYAELFDMTPDERQIIKAADKLSAYIKCVEETKSGNRDFLSAEDSIKKLLADMKLDELDYFISMFFDSFFQPLDELK